MPADEAKARMAAIRATVEASDVQRWARGFLDLLGEAVDEGTPGVGAVATAGMAAVGGAAPATG